MLSSTKFFLFSELIARSVNQSYCLKSENKPQSIILETDYQHMGVVSKRREETEKDFFCQVYYCIYTLTIVKDLFVRFIMVSTP